MHNAALFRFSTINLRIYAFIPYSESYLEILELGISSITSYHFCPWAPSSLSVAGVGHRVTSQMLLPLQCSLSEVFEEGHMGNSGVGPYCYLVG